MKKTGAVLVALAALMAMVNGAAFAQATDDAPAATEEVVLEEAAAIDSGDTAWVLASAALVLLMTPGLALFYGGMVRRKNILSTIMHSFVAMGILSIQWVLFGFSFSFGEGNAFFGDFSFLGLRGINPDSVWPGTTIPSYVFIAFQMMFAIITPALISGACAERMKFSAYVIFILVWGTLVYDPVCHWVWGGGWLGVRGAADFAGGTVVHMTSGFTALVLALMLGKRKGFPTEPIMPHSLPLTILGTGLLWFGWFGFNAGSALAANGAATMAFLSTNTAAAAAALTWMLLDWHFHKKPTALGTASGAVAGLVVITPAAGFVTPAAAILMGIIVAFICRFMLEWRTKKGIDDSLDAFAVHGMGGLTGAILTGVFATYGYTGLVKGNVGQFVEQIISAVATAVYAVVVSYIILKIIDATIGLRVDDKAEFEGLDLSQHGEAGYAE